MNNYKAFFGAYKNSVKAGNPYTKEEQVSIFTSGRTESLKELSSQELTELIALLNGKGNTLDKADTLRKALISVFHQMHYENAAAAAKAWAEKMGVGAGLQHQKRAFNDYRPQELKKLIYKAEIALADFRNNLREKLKQ